MRKPTVVKGLNVIGLELDRVTIISPDVIALLQPVICSDHGMSLSPVHFTSFHVCAGAGVTTNANHIAVAKSTTASSTLYLLCALTTRAAPRRRLEIAHYDVPHTKTPGTGPSKHGVKIPAS